MLMITKNMLRFKTIYEMRVKHKLKDLKHASFVYPSSEAVEHSQFSNT